MKNRNLGSEVKEWWSEHRGEIKRTAILLGVTAVSLCSAKVWYRQWTEINKDLEAYASDHLMDIPSIPYKNSLITGKQASLLTEFYSKWSEKAGEDAYGRKLFDKVEDFLFDYAKQYGEDKVQDIDNLIYDEMLEELA